MPAIKSLKKQLRGIRSIQKITKAMKTISTVKFSKLNAMYGQYSEYGKQCHAMFRRYGADFLHVIGEADPAAPAAVIVMAANKGLCGNFNAQILNFARDEAAKLGPVLFVACGKKAIGYFRGKKIPLEKEYVLNDIPTYEDSGKLLDDMLEWRRSGKVSGVYVIYPKYINMLEQVPAICELFPSGDSMDPAPVLLVPDRNTMVEKLGKTVFRAMFYELALESAIGAQAATLVTMRSAYDTATAYREQLEGELNRKRQSIVTADVIETSGEREAEEQMALPRPAAKKKEEEYG